MFDNLFMDETLKRVPISRFYDLKIYVFESQVYFSQVITFKKLFRKKKGVDERSDQGGLPPPMYI